MPPSVIQQLCSGIETSGAILWPHYELGVGAAASFKESEMYPPRNFTMTAAAGEAAERAKRHAAELLITALSTRMSEAQWDSACELWEALCQRLDAGEPIEAIQESVYCA